MDSNLSEQIKLFVSYAHADLPYVKIFIDKFKKAINKSDQYIWDIWNDRNLHVGSFWDQEIQNKIEGCNIALLLVSMAFMDSEYIKEKEFQEFLLKYKKRGILIFPILFAPCDYLGWKDLSIIQFFKPNGGKYGEQGIPEFTLSDLIKFNLKDGNVIPNVNLDRYILDLVKEIERSYSHFKESNSIVSTINNDYYLFNLTDYPKPSILFTGRDNELNRFTELFQQSRIFAIEGIGGTGKTQYASKCIEFIDKSKVLWLNGSAASKFDVFVTNLGYGEELIGAKQNSLTLYSGLKDLIEKDERIIFLDNFNDYNDPAFAEFLSFANSYLKKSTIVLITRIDPYILGITSLPTILIEGLEDDAINYAKKLKDSNINYSRISESDLIKLCIGVKGHPLAIELSMWLMSYGKNADELIVNIKEYVELKKVEEFSKRLFLDIFNHNLTTDEERGCLLRCSIFKDKFLEEEIAFLYDGTKIFLLLSKLVEKCLISNKHGIYEIHPLIRAFSYEMLDNRELYHLKIAKYYIQKRSKPLNINLEEKIFYHLAEAQEWNKIADSIELLGNEIFLNGHLDFLVDYLDKVKAHNINRPIFNIYYGDINQTKGFLDEASSYFDKASKDDENNVIKTQGMIKFGEVQFRKGNIQSSLDFFQTAYEYAIANSLLKERARAINDVGLVYTEYDKLEIALESLNEALKIRKEIDDYEGLAATYNNIGNIHKRNNKISKAIEFYGLATNIMRKFGPNRELSIYLSNTAVALRDQNKLEESIIKIKEVLSLSEKIGDKVSICNSLNLIGSICILNGKDQEGVDCFIESAKMSSEIGIKRELSDSYSLIGWYYFEKKKDYEKCLFYLLKGLSIINLMGSKIDQRDLYNKFSIVKKQMGNSEFRNTLDKIYNSLDEEVQTTIELEKLYDEPFIRSSTKIGRNDPCPCGSHKKYKNCHMNKT